MNIIAKKWTFSNTRSTFLKYTRIFCWNHYEHFWKNKVSFLNTIKMLFMFSKTGMARFPKGYRLYLAIGKIYIFFSNCHSGFICPFPSLCQICFLGWSHGPIPVVLSPLSNVWVLAIHKVCCTLAEFYYVRTRNRTKYLVPKSIYFQLPKEPIHQHFVWTVFLTTEGTVPVRTECLGLPPVTGRNTLSVMSRPPVTNPMLVV